MSREKGKSTTSIKKRNKLGERKREKTEQLNKERTQKNKSIITKQNKTLKINKNNKTNEINLYLLNIQELTSEKMFELEDLMKEEKCLVILTETQKKIQNIKINEGIVALDSMRDFKDKKGGGLMLLHWKDENIQLEKRDLGNKDIMLLQGTLYSK